MKQKGMSLVELLIACAIGSVVVLSSAFLLSDSFRFNRESEIRQGMDTTLIESLQNQLSREQDSSKNETFSKLIYLTDIKKLIIEDGNSDILVQKCFKEKFDPSIIEDCAQKLGGKWYQFKNINPIPKALCFDKNDSKIIHPDKCFLKINISFKLVCNPAYCEQILFTTERKLDSTMINDDRILTEVKNLSPDFSVNIAVDIVPVITNWSKETFTCDPVDDFLLTYDFLNGLGECGKCSKNCGTVSPTPPSSAASNDPNLGPKDWIYCFPKADNTFYKAKDKFVLKYDNLKSPEGNESWQSVELLCNNKNLSDQLFKNKKMKIDELIPSGEIEISYEDIISGSKSNSDPTIALHCSLKIKNNYDDYKELDDGKIPFCKTSTTDPTKDPGAGVLSASGIFSRPNPNNPNSPGNTNGSYATFSYPSCVL